MHPSTTSPTANRLYTLALTPTWDHARRHQTTHGWLGQNRQPPRRARRQTSSLQLCSATAVKHNMNWKTSSHPMQQAGYKAFIKGWEELPILQCHQLFNPAPQTWLIPKYISSHISLPYFITHVDFQYSFLMHLVSTHKTHWLGRLTPPSLSRTFVVWALKLMHPEKIPFVSGKPGQFMKL